MTPAEGASLVALSFAVTLGAIIVLPRAKPDPQSAEQPPPVEYVVVRPTADDPKTSADQVLDLEQRVKALQVKLDRIESKAGKR